MVAAKIGAGSNIVGARRDAGWLVFLSFVISIPNLFYCLVMLFFMATFLVCFSCVMRMKAELTLGHIILTMFIPTTILQRPYKDVLDAFNFCQGLGYMR